VSDRNAYLLRTYGITEEQYAEMHWSQGGKCAICKRKAALGTLVVDHDHKSGRVRGLLCRLSCNYRLLGRQDQKPEIFLSAYAYLVSPPAVAVLGEHVVPTKKRRKKAA
jgi:hypothetical protein